MAIPGIESAERAISQLAKERHQDVDETRRLLYMALVVNKTKKYNLAGTLINALRHHRGVTDPDLEGKVVAFIEGTEDHDAWIREQITNCTASLDGGA